MGAMATPSIWLPSPVGSPAHKRKLIYFICGNPGLIEYYRDFLTYLRGLLDKANHGDTYDIYGRSLPGFRDSDHEPFTPKRPPHDLESVVGRMYSDVKDRGAGYEGVLTMGHSVGAWISVEIWHRYLGDLKNGPAPGGEEKLRLANGILLFPTVAHIALSPSGVVFTTLMRRVPLLERHGHLLARMVVSLVPAFVLGWWIEKVMGFAASAARTTVDWLRSRDGVWQTLRLAGDEMAVIGADEERWGREIWGAVDEGDESGGDGDGVPRFFMFYGAKDHWVADHVRDEFMERMRRRREVEGAGARRVPRIVVDEEGLKHAFCTKDDSSFKVAMNVCGWIGEIDEGRRKR